jgi:hypothetical protein
MAALGGIDPALRFNSISMEASEVKAKNLPDTTLGVVRDVSNVTFELARVPIALLLSPFFLGRSERRKELRADIVELRQLLRIATEEGSDKDLAAALNFLAEHSKQIQRAFVVWMDLIEVLVQDAERRYGSAGAMGELKAAHVKGVVQYLMRNRSFDIPDVPKFLEPVIIDVVIDWSIDVALLLVNRYGLWVEKGSTPKARSLLTTVKSQFRRAVLGVVGLFFWVYVRIRQTMQREVMISPEVKAAIDAVRREGVIVHHQELFKGIADLLVWVSAKKRTLMMLVEVTSAAVQQAEVYVSLTGAQKKAYARDLVLAALAELGFEQGTGLLFSIIDSTIQGSIETSVNLFNKRGIFSH